MAVLADTSVWIDYFRSDQQFAELSFLSLRKMLRLINAGLPNTRTSDYYQTLSIISINTLNLATMEF